MPETGTSSATRGVGALPQLRLSACLPPTLLRIPHDWRGERPQPRSCRTRSSPIGVGVAVGVEVVSETHPVTGARDWPCPWAGGKRLGVDAGPDADPEHTDPQSRRQRSEHRRRGRYGCGTWGRGTDFDAVVAPSRARLGRCFPTGAKLVLNTAWACAV